MDLKQTGLFTLAERRLAWLDRRQEVLAHNIANSDTPGFQSRDLAPFAAALARAHVAPLVQTQPNHLPGSKAGCCSNQSPSSQRNVRLTAMPCRSRTN